MQRRDPGDVIVLRGVWRGRPWVAIAAVVVQDEPDLIALYIPEGAPFDFAPVAPIPFPWQGRAGWEGHGVLWLHRPGDRYTVWVFWEGPEREFSVWYVNFQTALTRSSIGFDMLDHELDLWSRDGKTWHWKDDELLDSSASPRASSHRRKRKRSATTRRGCTPSSARRAFGGTPPGRSGHRIRRGRDQHCRPDGKAVSAIAADAGFARVRSLTPLR